VLLRYGVMRIPTETPPTVAEAAIWLAALLMPDARPSSLWSTLDLTDAVHLAVLDRLGVTDVFAVDRRFLALLG